MNEVLQELSLEKELAVAAEREVIAQWVEDMCEGLDYKTIAMAIRNGGNDSRMPIRSN